MLRLEGINLRFKGFSLSMDIDVAKGARLGLLGPSGSGKSTALSVIAGFLKPDKGRVRIAGQDVTDLPVPERPLSLLFQDGNLFPHLSAFDNVALGLKPNLKLSEAEHEAVDHALDQVGLRRKGAQKPSDLSGGQRSRLALARMLLRNQPLALLDEPFSALDPGLRREMLALVDDLCRETGLTLVMVSHDLRDVERLCTDLCLLDAGQVQIRGALGPILHDPPDELKPWL